MAAIDFINANMLVQNKRTEFTKKVSPSFDHMYKNNTHRDEKTELTNHMSVNPSIKNRGEQV
uniref:Uncharacterized protein n=1 Tax=Cucumis melo TaxID=3656 RepID=A0A9I9E7C5_CUCME